MHAIDDVPESSTKAPQHEPSLLRFGWVFVAVLVALTGWAFLGSDTPQRTAAGERVRPGDAYNPVTAGERLPDGFRQLLPRDAIAPVYDPTFVDAAQAGWPDSTEVIGVEINGDARAYPVSFLGGRELVVDEIGGEPVLVSW